MSRDAVIEYYDQCHVDYRILWRSHRNLCIHFGYFDEEHDSHAKALPNMNRVLAAKAGVREGDEVLDAGCGVGGSSIWLAHHCGARVCGVNIQPLHLRIAAKETARRGLGHLVRFEERNYCDTGLPADSFDVVWALESLCHSDDKPGFLREAFRLLRPGGRLMVADFFQRKPEWDEGESARMRLWLDGWALPELAEVAAFSEEIRSKGFEVPTVEDITPAVLRSSRRIWKASLVILPLSGMLERSGFRTSRQTANVLAARHQYPTIREGLWGYFVFTARKPPHAPPQAPPGPDRTPGL